MSRHEEMCPHCRAKQAGDTETVVAPGPITAELPEQPRVFRIHFPDGHTRDYTLHPDGRLTLAIHGQVLTTALDFEFMAGTSWAGGHIEWDPSPLVEEPEPNATPVAVQDAIPLTA
jgi:hypothetical protein